MLEFGMISFALEYLKNLPILLFASSMAVLLPGIFFVTASLALGLDNQPILLVLLLWLGGHIFAAPGLLLAYLPTVVVLNKRGARFESYVLFAVFYAFVNCLPLVESFEFAEMDSIFIFVMVGFLTGVFYFTLTRDTSSSDGGTSVPIIGRLSFIVVVFYLSLVFLSLDAF